MRMFLMIVPPILIGDFLVLYLRGGSIITIVLANIILVPLFSAIYIYVAEPIIKRMQDSSKEENEDN